MESILLEHAANIPVRGHQTTFDHGNTRVLISYAISKKLGYREGTLTRPCMQQYKQIRKFIVGSFFLCEGKEKKWRSFYLGNEVPLSLSLCLRSNLDSRMVCPLKKLYLGTVTVESESVFGFLILHLILDSVGNHRVTTLAQERNLSRCVHFSTEWLGGGGYPRLQTPHSESERVAKQQTYDARW